MSAARIAGLSRLADVVGAPHFIVERAGLACYEVDGKTPAAAVLPGSPEEVAAIVQFAIAENLAVIPSGARTKLGIGMPPRQYDLALDLSRLDRIVAYDPGDLTLSVEAGIPLCKLQSTLFEHGQFLPLAVPFMNRTTAGGTIASGMDSPLRQSYGTARDYVLGMEFVTGEGILARSGGRVVKNVAGYDLHKLMIGALGTLGIITKINFRTFPRPGGNRGFLASFETAERALELRHGIAHSPLTPLTLDILSPRAAELAFAGLSPAPQTLAHGEAQWMLAAGYAGNEKVLARYEHDLRLLAKQAKAASIAIICDKDCAAAWIRLREFISIVLESSPAATIMKISILPTRMKAALDAAATSAETRELPWAALARGAGVLYFALLPIERSEDVHRRVAQAAEGIQSVCASLGGHATIPWCPANWKPSLNIWGREQPAFAQMRKMKNVFDPHGIFNPGRFVGGI